MSDDKNTGNENFEGHQDAGELKRQEAIIAEGLKTFLPMCKALHEIKEKELWKQGGYTSFPQYCQQRWSLDASQASRLIRCALVVHSLSDHQKLPENDGQCRILGRLEPDQRNEVWNEVVESGRKPTAELITTVAQQKGYLEQKNPPPPKEPELPVKTRQISSAIADLLVEVGEVSKLSHEDRQTVLEFVNAITMKIKPLVQFFLEKDRERITELNAEIDRIDHE